MQLMRRCGPDAVALAVYAGGLLALTTQVNRVMPEPYMDEIFHVPQTVAYCEGRWREWDDKITTLPGAYVLAALGHRLFGLACSVASLRLVTAGLSVLLLLVTLLLLHRLHPHASALHRCLRGLVLVAMPFHFFFQTLWYSDVPSTLAVLLVLLLHLRPTGHTHPVPDAHPLPRSRMRAVLAGAAGAAAVLVRQTNVIWVAFALASGWIQEIEQHRRCGAAQDKEQRSSLPKPLTPSPSWTPLGPPLPETPSASRSHLTLTDLPSVLRYLFLSFPSPLLRELPSLLVLLGFLAFVRLNGGIVVGDRANHLPVLHLPQLLYCLLFVALTATPAGSLLSLARSLRSSSSSGSSRSRRSNPRGVLSTLLAWLTFPRVLGLGLVTVAMALALQHLCIVHPFLLADNRHYSFYIYQRLFARFPLAKFALVPLYLAALLLLDRLLAPRRGALWRLALLLCATAATIFSPLVEPRYFLPVFFLVGVHLPFAPEAADAPGDPEREGGVEKQQAGRGQQRPSGARSFLVADTIQLVAHVAGSALLLFVFLNRPFRWPDGSVARFMP